MVRRNTNPRVLILKKIKKYVNKNLLMNRIPRQVRLNLRRKQLASKAMKTVKTSERCSKLKEKIAEAERFLSSSYFNFKLDKENKAIDKMYENKKSFFTYMKSKNKERTKIGPFVDNKGKVIDDIPANTLQKQNSDMWSSPRPEVKLIILTSSLKLVTTKMNLRLLIYLSQRRKLGSNQQSQD